MFEVKAKIKTKNELEKVGNELSSWQNRTKRRMAIDLLTKIVVKTPVDTGRARGGWGVGVSEDPKPTGAIDKNGTATIQKGLHNIAQADSVQDIVIANNVHYVVHLEKGHSKQAPKGMVKVSIDEVERNFKNGVYG